MLVEIEEKGKATNQVGLVSGIETMVGSIAAMFKVRKPCKMTLTLDEKEIKECSSILKRSTKAAETVGK